MARALRHWHMPADYQHLPLLKRLLLMLAADREIIDEEYIQELRLLIEKLEASANWQPKGPVTDDSPISILEIPALTNRLSPRDTTTIGQLREWTEEDLTDLPNFGTLGMDELRFKLGVCGITLKKTRPPQEPDS